MHLEKEAVEGFHARLHLLEQQESSRGHNILFTCAENNIFSLSSKPILAEEETCDKHNYTRHSDRAIADWMRVASTDAAEKRQEKEGCFRFQAFHEVGQ